ncbi:MAG: hypothetical protein WBX19_08505 [Terracidiphilus sp.]
MNIFSRYLCWASLALAIAAGVAGCKSNQNPESAQNQAQDQDPSQDPAAANVAPISNASAEQGGESGYPAPQSDQYASDQYPQGQNNNDYENYDQPVDYAAQAPPPLPEYDQPPCPGDNYIWTPGYWNYGSAGYYWVPGAWVHAPYQGALWTPGYWSYTGNRYGWHRGYWGRHIGYYGGINYGFGYVGYGYQGGYWRGNSFNYNRSVNNVNTTVIRNVYNYRVVNETTTVNRVSYNGPGGVQVKPRPAEIAALHEQHNPPMSAQVQQIKTAQANRANFVAMNHGRPQIVTVAQPLPADHNIRPPAAVAMRNQPTVKPQPTPKEQGSAQRELQHPAPVQQPERQQPAPARQAPEQHAQPAPERQAAGSQLPTQERRPAQVEHPQNQGAAPHPAPQEHAAPAPQHKPSAQQTPENRQKPQDKEKRPE